VSVSTETWAAVAAISAAVSSLITMIGLTVVIRELERRMLHVSCWI
jgi:uncharacterized membrane protein YccF (DUF307 family)